MDDIILDFNVGTSNDNLHFVSIRSDGGLYRDSETSDIKFVLRAAWRVG